jgi:arginyl-tRNA synthetase
VNLFTDYAAVLKAALAELTDAGTLPAGLTPDIQVENTKDRSHGDFASNIAMMLAKPAGMKPRDLAARLVEAIPAPAQGQTNPTRLAVSGRR